MDGLIHSFNVRVVQSILFVYDPNTDVFSGESFAKHWFCHASVLSKSKNGCVGFDGGIITGILLRLMNHCFRVWL